MGEQESYGGTPGWEQVRDLTEKWLLSRKCAERGNCAIGLGMSCPDWREHLADVQVFLPGHNGSLDG